MYVRSHSNRSLTTRIRYALEGLTFLETASHVTVSLQNYTLRNLQKHTNYVITLAVKNLKGVGPNATVDLRTEDGGISHFGIWHSRRPVSIAVLPASFMCTVIISPWAVA